MKAVTRIGINAQKYLIAGPKTSTRSPQKPLSNGFTAQIIDLTLQVSDER
jgi:hypothetical protein